VIILDTNVVSEPTKLKGSPKVLDWLDAQHRETLYFTTISLGEVLAGLAMIPEGKRKTQLVADTHALIETLFGQRILPYDLAAAEAYAEIFKASRAAGKPIALVDAQIAAIARAHGFAVATRDVTPFEAGGVEVINPWL
jgi:toxin FitB